EQYGLGPARCYVCGQDSQRRQARRSASRAAEEVRATDKPQDGKADRPDDSAYRARAGGQGNQMSRGEKQQSSVRRMTSKGKRSALSCRSRQEFRVRPLEYTN